MIVLPVISLLLLLKLELRQCKDEVESFISKSCQKTSIKLLKPQKLWRVMLQILLSFFYLMFEVLENHLVRNGLDKSRNGKIDFRLLIIHLNRGRRLNLKL